MGDASMWGLLAATFTASFVECVEALTIVLAMGLTRGWRSAIAGTIAALATLAVFAAAVGYAAVRVIPVTYLKLGIGTLLLIFGLQWLRKAILRSAGRKALHDEDAEFAAQTASAQRAGRQTRWGLDWFGTVVSFKGVFLEGAEVVFIVVTFGASAGRIPAAAGAAIAAALVVAAIGLIAHRPLAAVPENTLKYAVGLLLATYGTFWAGSGLGVLTPAGAAFPWPGEDLALLAILAGWLALSRALVAGLRPTRKPTPSKVEAR